MPLAKSRKYCSICSNYRGKEVDGRVISLHRFPANDKIRKIWLARARLVRKDFAYSVNCQMCPAHCVGQGGPTKENIFPSIFPDKIYKLSNSSSSEFVLEENKENQETVQACDQVVDQQQFPNGLQPEAVLHLSVMLDDNVRMLDRSEVVHNQTMIVSTATQTDPTSVRQANYAEAGTQTPMKKTTECGTQVISPVLTFESIEHDDQKVLFYTGLPNAQTFNALFDEIQHDATVQTARNGATTQLGRPRNLRLIDEFFLVLMRLRLGLLLEDLADRFYIGTSTCSVIFNKWIDYLDVQLAFLVQWPSREITDQHMPSAFREKYPTCRVIVDCTELRTETPASLQSKSLMYSDYKSHMTWKGLIGISPAGVVTNVSELWSGSVSDKQITASSGIIEMCEPGDIIMADKGFLISDMTTSRGVNLVIPPFKQGKKQLCKREVETTRTIANLRIHAERQMERVKNFNILKSVIPLNMAHGNYVFV